MTDDQPIARGRKERASREDEVPKVGMGRIDHMKKIEEDRTSSPTGFASVHPDTQPPARRTSDTPEQQPITRGRHERASREPSEELQESKLTRPPPRPSHLS